MRAIASVVLISLAGAAASGPYSYVCSLTDYFVANKPSERDWLAKSALKSELTIDRRTGRAFHPIIGSQAFEQVLLIDFGSSEWAFKSAAIVRGIDSPGSFFRYYEVYEFNEGEEKGMMAVADGIAYRGTCR